MAKAHKIPVDYKIKDKLLDIQVGRLVEND